jgi:hypothetical protein
MLAKSTGLYASVRMGVCGEWIDHTTISSMQCVAKLAAESADARDPDYAARKPLLRIARIEIREVES